MRSHLLAFFTVLLFAAALRSGTADPLALHTGRYGMPAVVVGGGIDVVGGCGANGLLSDIERIDPAKGTVQDIPTKLKSRRWHTAQASGPFIYVLGGTVDKDTTTNFSSVVERYDTRTGKIAEMAPLPTPRRNAQSVLSGGKIYVVGGSTVGDVHEVGTVEIYDIKADTWTTGAPMPTPRECALAVKDGVIYAAGGYDGAKAIATVEAYDIASDAWRTLPSLPAPTSAHHVVVSGNLLLLFGDYAQLDRAASYNVKTGAYTALTQIGYLPSRHNAVVLLRGMVYVIGGNTRPDNTSALSLIQTFPLAP